MARVLPEYRCRGVGSELVRALSEHGRALGRNGVNSFVEWHDEPSIRFAEKLGLAEVDYQLEQVRLVGAEAEPELPTGIEVVAIADRRDELLAKAWPVAQQGYEDMPLPGAVTHPRESWLRDEATRPDGTFVAFDGGELVGYAGMTDHANGDATAEHGLTVVRRDRRRRGIARALKLSQLHWASSTGVVELITWTQKGNEAHAGAQREPRLRDSLARPDDAGADAVSIRVEVVEENEAALEAWAAIKSRVEPDDPITPEQVARGLTPSRLLILAPPRRTAGRLRRRRPLDPRWPRRRQATRPAGRPRARRRPSSARPSDRARTGTRRGRDRLVRRRRRRALDRLRPPVGPARSRLPARADARDSRRGAAARRPGGDRDRLRQ